MSISLALGASKKPNKPAPTTRLKRLHDDGEDEEHDQGQVQIVSHFESGAIDEKNVPTKHAPLVIQPQANRDWREASQRNKRQRTSKFGVADSREEDINASEADKPVYGLNVRKQAENGDHAQTNGHAASSGEDDEMLDSTANGDEPEQELTADEEAMNALLGKSTSQKTLVVPAMTEEEAFERDYKTAPDMATLEDYDRVPVEQFGAAMLRGMGWKEGEGIGANKGKKLEKTKIPERRPALLGIGAKEEAAVAQEMGTWGKAAKDKKGPVQVYNPVLLRDKKTGELLTEAEVEQKKLKEEKERYEMEFEREERHKEKTRRRRDTSESRDLGHDGRDRGSKRDRSNRAGHDRRRYDSDEEYYRKKEKERRRREREREDDDYDLERSRRHRDKGKHRDHRR